MTKGKVELLLKTSTWQKLQMRKNPVIKEKRNGFQRTQDDFRMLDDIEIIDLIKPQVNKITNLSICKKECIS